MDATALVALLLIIIIAACVIAAILIIFASKKKKQAGQPAHIELYFAENFRNLVDEWDLQSRSKVKSWRSDMTKRLNSVGTDIDRLKTFQKKMDARLERLNKDVVRLEKI